MKPQSKKSLFQEQMLTIATVISVVLGVVIGLMLRSSETKWTKREIMYLNFPGEIFLRTLKALILPLIVSSLITAIGSLDVKLSGKIGSRAVAFYLTTTFLSVVMGIILSVTIQPGISWSSSSNEAVQTSNKTISTKNFRNTTTVDTILDLIRNMAPPNLVQATTEQYQTHLISPPEGKASKFHASSSDQQPSLKPIAFLSAPMEQWEMTSSYVSGMNIMGLVVAATAAGIGMSAMKGKVNTLLAFVDEVSQLSMKITGWVILISPIGIFFLIISQILEMDDLSLLLGKLGVYTATVFFGLVFHGLVVLPFIYFCLTRKNPYVFISGISQALATAFGTASR